MQRTAGSTARLVAAGALVLGTCVAMGAPAIAGVHRRRVGNCDWPMYGQNVERTFASPCETPINAQNAGDLRRIWFFNAKDTVTATPAVAGDTVYVGDWSANFYALRLGDGKPRWTFRAEQHRPVYAGQIVSSATVADVKGTQTVYFGSGKSLYALRAGDGGVRWRFDVAPPHDDGNPTEIESSPLLVDNLVIFGTDVHNSGKGYKAGVFALDATTGKKVWQTVTAPTSGEGATGPGCGDVWGSASVDRAAGLVFVGTGNCDTSPSGYGRFSEAIVALDLKTGAVRWTYQPHQPNRDDFDFAGAPNLFERGGRKLVGLGNKDAVYYAVDRQTGALAWKTPVTLPGIAQPGSNYSFGGFIGPAAYAGGTVVGGTAVGGSPALHALDAGTGAIRWQQPAAGPTYAAAAAANGVVFLGGTDFTFRALDLGTGKILWSQSVQGAVSGGAAVVGDDVVTVAGIREPGTTKKSRTSGVYRFSLHGKPVPSTTTTTPATEKRGGPPPPEPTDCVQSPCQVPFELKTPPPGLQPALTLTVTPSPWKVEVQASGLGAPDGWLRPGSTSQQSGATRYGLFMSERDDNPSGGLLCVLDADLRCSSTRIPRPGATYNRISLLAITDSNQLPTPADGYDRLVTTKSFTPPLAPRSR